MRKRLLSLLLPLVCAHADLLAAATPQLVSATYLGTPGHDDLQDVAISEDGTIYVVGNVDQVLTNLPEGVKAVTLGKPVEGTWYRCGLLATFSPDGAKMLRCVQFARGQVFLTTVALGKDGVYIGGYGSEELAELLKPLGGVFADARQANAAPLPQPLPEAPATPAAEKEKAAAAPAAPTEAENVLYIKTRHHGDKGGVPFVARLGNDLTTLGAGTFLEGHHYAWNVAMPLYEEEWTPTGIAILPGGDLVVLHDGGAPVHHYYAPDYLSRLSPDLKRRAWKFDIYHPEVKPLEKIRNRGERFKGWKFPILGQVRTLRMRGDAAGNVYVGGWSVSMTSREPWWCPFLWKFNGNGELVWKAYTFDPMSGSGDRVNGLVSDSAIRSMAFDQEGGLLVSGISDGGNTVLRCDPRDYSKPAKFKAGFGGMKGRVEYVGHIMRLDEQTRELLAGSGFGSYAQGKGYQATWAVDLCPLAGKRVLAVGRHNLNYPDTPDAWFHIAGDKGMFLKVLSHDFAPQFSVNVPDAIPYTAACRGTRCVVVGIAASEKTPVQRAVFPKYGGGMDGYLLVADFPE